MRVDLSSRDRGSVQAFTISHQESLSYPLHFRTKGRSEYFVRKAPFSLVNMIKGNPMVRSRVRSLSLSLSLSLAFVCSLYVYMCVPMLSRARAWC